jgi:hypothetical protein
MKRKIQIVACKCAMETRLAQTHRSDRRAERALSCVYVRAFVFSVRLLCFVSSYAHLATVKWCGHIATRAVISKKLTLPVRRFPCKRHPAVVSGFRSAPTGSSRFVSRKPVLSNLPSHNMGTHSLASAAQSGSTPTLDCLAALSAEAGASKTPDADLV